MEKVGLRLNQQDIIRPAESIAETVNPIDLSQGFETNAQDFGGNSVPGVQREQSSETIKSYAEQYKEVELERVLADTEVMGGISLRYAAALCPVDISKYSTEQRNDFIVKMLNKPSTVIDSSASGLVEAGLQKLGLDKKFSVQPTKPEDAIKHETKTVLDETKPAANQASIKSEVSADVQPHDYLERPEDKLKIPSLEQIKKPESEPVNLAAKLFDTAKDMIRKEVEPPVISLSEKQTSKANFKIKRAPKTEVTELDNSVESSPPLDMSQNEEVIFRPAPIEAGYINALSDNIAIELTPDSANPEDQLKHSMAESETGRPYPGAVQEVTGVLSQAEYESKTTIILKLEEELVEDESKIAKDFIAGINSLIEVSIAVAESMGLDEALELANDSKNSVVYLLNEIVVRTELTEGSIQEQANQTIKQLVGALHGKLLLEQAGSDELKIQYVDRAIETLCLNLLDQLDIAHDPESISKLIQLLTSTTFFDGMLGADYISLADIESVGTREIKRFRKEILSKITLFKTDVDMVRKLGLTALLRLIEVELGVNGARVA